MGQLRLSPEGTWEQKGRDYVTSRDQRGDVRSRHLPQAPQTIEQRIFNIVWANNRAVSRREIAKDLGLSSTAWLNAKIDSLVDQGYLTRIAYQYRPNMLQYKYSVIK